MPNKSLSNQSLSSKSPEILNYQHYYLVGIKGVAMTALAQMLHQAGKKISGSDVKENFVTAKQLAKIDTQIDHDFNQSLPAGVDCLIYTAAHQGPNNPQVQQAQKKTIKVYSQAEATASFFNTKQGLAVCGVGGKSTTSAMISWILTKLEQNPSFAVGVGEIIGLDCSAKWHKGSQYFVAEADEYVIDPQAAEKGEEIEPKFSLMKPYLTVCTNLKYDHPDVYQNLAHTQQVFLKFFKQIKQFGHLVINGDDLAQTSLANDPDLQARVGKDELIITTYGENQAANWQLKSFETKQGFTLSQIEFANQQYQLKLKIPGKFNALNALAAVAACAQIGIKPEESLKALAEFQSTMRRFEQVGVKDGVVYFDDYAHHPLQIKQTIKAFKQWLPKARRVVAFQPHTYSRTKELFNDFADALSDAKEVVLLDIFSSAREKFDPTVSSDLLVKTVKEKYPQVKIANLKTIKSLADFCHNQLEKGDGLITLGAGDIYKVHQLV